MSEVRNIRIAGTGMYVPPRRVTNQDLEKLMDTSDEWIRKRSGIETRYHAEEDVSTSELGVLAAREAIEKAGVSPGDIDLVITATLSPDHYFPGIGVQIQHGLGMSTTPAMDVRNQCSGFLYGLETARAFIASGQADRVLVVCAEIHSKLIDMSTKGRDIAVLFGDGAAALVVEPSTYGGQGVLSSRLHAEGRYADRLWIDKPGTAGKEFLTEEHVREGLHLPRMDGRYVFKHATTRLEQVVRAILDSGKLAVSDINCFLFHQANLRINEHVAKSMGIPTDKLLNNINKFGNCSSASLPMLIHEAVVRGTIREGDLICLGAFGSGFTWGGMLLRW